MGFGRLDAQPSLNRPNGPQQGANGPRANAVHRQNGPIQAKTRLE
jgi:hypothetical protein